MRSVFDLSTEEAYHIVRDHFGRDLPPLAAIENEDWGRDYVLQVLQEFSAGDLAAVGLTWEAAESTGPENRTPGREGPGVSNG